MVKGKNAVNVVFCDVDGVIMDCRHRLKYISGKKKNYEKFYDTRAVLKDKPIAEGILLVLALKRLGFKVVFTTSRRSQCLAATTKQIQDVMDYDGLLMRHSFDRRKSWLVKEDQIKIAKKNYFRGKKVYGYFIDDDPRNCEYIAKKFKTLQPIIFGTNRLEELIDEEKRNED